MDRLDNPIRRYAWGSASDLPEFAGLPSDGGPQAELWMGAHPDDPSLVRRNGTARSLAEIIEADPVAELGPDIASRFGGRLPFLLKILAAEHPLSLQVHPGKTYAQAAYAAQVRAGTADGDYTDDNHKPELICALRDGFQALSGFRPVPDTLSLLDELAVPQLTAWTTLLTGQDAAAGLRTLVTEILTERQDHSAAIAAIATAADRVAAGGGRRAATGAAYSRLAAAYPADPGVLVALLLNHAVLAEGEALFTGAGVAHCYLAGLGAEIMASSDNVLRAGLTSKRVNVPELLRVLDFRPAPVRVLRPEPDGDAESYPVPVPDFRLSRLQLGEDARPVLPPEGGPQIVLCITGTAALRTPDGAELSLRRGESAFVPASCAGATVSGPATILRAGAGRP